MNTRRGFFSALAGAVTGTAAGAVPVAQKSQRFAVGAPPLCNCGYHMFPNVANEVEVFRCCNSACPNHTKFFQHPTELQQLAKVYPPLMQTCGDLIVRELDWPG